MARWLLKSEPDVFGYDDLVAAKREGWDGVRNYQARKIVKGAEPDPTQFDPKSKYFDPKSSPDDPRWDWVTVAPKKRLRFISLDQLREMPELVECRLLARGNRLSVIPLTDDEFDAIVAAGS
jgi:predicted RNA-binding protein with PUA-like domain